MDLVKQGSPLDWELARRRSELQRLERELASREAALAHYQANLDAFERRYFQAFAQSFDELKELEVRIAEKEAQVRPDDATKRRKAERARARLTAGPAQEAEQEPSWASQKTPPSAELRAVYHALSKLIHPDLAAHEGEVQERQQLMVRANAAYAEGNMATLTSLLDHQAPDEKVSIEDILTGVMHRIVLMREQLARPVSGLAAIENSELARLMHRALLLEGQGRDLFAKIADEIAEYAHHARKRIKTLDRRLAKKGDT